LIRSRKAASAAGLLLALSLVAAACGGDDSSSSDTTAAAETTAASASTTAGGAATSGAATTAGSATTTGGEPAGGTITYGYEQEFFAYNPNTADANAASNAVVLNPVLPGSFQYGPDGTLIMDPYLFTKEPELTSEDPQVVTYDLNPDAVWSDGEPIDCVDFKLQWVANNGVYKQKNADGTVATDDTGAELTLFQTAGTTGYESMKSVECDGNTITVTYSEPFGDWQSMFSQLMPAHILAAQTGVDVEAAIDSANEADLAKMADFWNTGWNLNPGELKPDIMPSGGPYTITDWQAGQSLTLSRNDAYWGPKPQSDTIIFRYIPQDAQAQALANQEIQAMDPQPNPDLVAQLEQLDGITVENFDLFTFEHVDFNFANPDLQIPEVREAFAKCLPRQQIVDTLIKPQNPQAEVLNNRWFESFEQGYQDNSGGKFDDVDIEGAKALLDQAGKTGLALRIGYRTPNQRRTNEVELIKASCEQAGFSISDAGSDTFFSDELVNGNFDVALFAWTGSPLKTGSSSTYTTGGGNNQGKYSNAKVDDLIAQLNKALDKAKQSDLANQIDTQLWADLATVPIFTFPGIMAHADSVSNVVANATQAGLTWNVQEWTAA